MLMYSLQDFNKISYNGFEVTLPEDVIKDINELVKKVGSPSYIKTPVFQKIGRNDIGISNAKKRRDKERERQENHDNWERIKKFYPTKIEEKTGIDSQVNNIRSFLNKLTDKNSIEITNNIIEIIKEVNKLENVEERNENIKKIGNVLFDIASTNRFFSKVYADVYSCLCSECEDFYEIIETNYEIYMNSFSNINYVAPETDYNTFCQNNKLNDKRRALSAFFLNLYCSGVIPFEKIEKIVVYLLNTINTLVNEDDKEAIIDEFTENVFILYSKDMEYSEVLKLNNNNTIFGTISFYANSKSTGHNFPSLTTKCTFKYMDMIGI